MSVTWVVNARGKHEISSKEHLLQVMTNGTLYTNEGSTPQYFHAGCHYEQTVDIDLEFDTNITPIGSYPNRSTPYRFMAGSYDGGNFSISNWSFDDPSNTAQYVGLFAYSAGVTLENIRLTGVWTYNGDAQRVSFLTAFADLCTIRNIDCSFDEGTYVNCQHATSYATFGSVIGDSRSNTVHGVTVRGFINLVTDAVGKHGGVVGHLDEGTYVGLRNAAVWTNGLTGALVGGIAGHVTTDIEHVTTDTNVTHAVNTMVGDITGDTCGGLFGQVDRVGGGAVNTCVNSMNGNITATANAGGIIGHTYCEHGSSHMFDMTNYMTGDIVSSNNTSGGLIGLVSRRYYLFMCTVSNSVVAMNGSSDEAVLGTVDFTPTVSTKIDTGFGFTYTSATYGSTSDGFTGTTSTLFPDLDYIPLTFSDDASNSYEYEVVFGNVGGSSSYPQYTHAIISKNDISGPYHIDFDLAGDTAEFLTYLSVSDSTVVAYTDGSMTISDSGADIVYDYTGTTTLRTKTLASHIEVTGTGAIHITVAIAPIAEADAYQIRYTPTSGGSTVLAHSGFTELNKVVTGLSPDVEYEVFLYYLPTGSSTYTLSGSKTATTLANTAASYDLGLYGSGGKYDLSVIDDLGNISQVMNDLFTSGDELSINLGSKKTPTTFVKLGDNISIPDNAALIPFGSASGQAVTFTLPDNTSQVVSYDEVLQEIIVEGNTYGVGDTFIMNGLKTTVLSL